ncbi:MAG: sigma-70 family RNA polymerase sigma factor [Hungatella sp.]|nr:sigma-70 family RNA polymerase sigma factor [Hungatella sp.]
MDSMEEIYKSHGRTVYGFLLTRTRNPDEAQELTQETFCRALKHLKEFKGESSVSTWLCGIAQNVWLEYVRRQKRRREAEITAGDLPDVPGAEEGKQESVQDNHMLRWESLEVLKALHQLREPMRENMYLRLIGNLTFAQIGEVMGRSENWARVTFYRGKELIIKEVKKNG